MRIIERPFAWVPFRVLTDGVLGNLSVHAQLLYFFLCLVADRDGLSFYSDRRIEDILHIGRAELLCARYELVRCDLVEHDGRVYQVLSLPAHSQR